MEAWLAEGLKALVAGMGTVFVVLILIAIIISLFQHIGDKEPKIKREHKAVPVPAVVETADVAKAPELDDLELVAVITAAIAASMETTTDKLIVKSFRRVGRNTKWNLR